MKYKHLDPTDKKQRCPFAPSDDAQRVLVVGRERHRVFVFRRAGRQQDALG